MITGWKSISAETGYSRNTLKKLVDEESFPIQWIASKPTTTANAIEQWFLNRLNNVASSYAGMSSAEITQRMAL